MGLTFLNITNIVKKVTMGIAGLFLMSFLAVHLGINLLMLKGDNGAAFSGAVHFMTSSMFIKLFEIVLFAAFIIHILIGVLLKLSNWRNRPVRYKVCLKSDTSFFSKYMIWTGLVILTFLIIHFMNFYFVKLGWVAKPEVAKDIHDFYPMAVALFSNPVYSWLYIVLIAGLGFHLYHAFHSFFQTIGFQHSKYFGWIKAIGAVYAIGIALGFIIIPVYFMFFFN
jgi:succinate dehydrogenase / fumarate reductase, cytochrome b subunit